MVGRGRGLLQKAADLAIEIFLKARDLDVKPQNFGGERVLAGQFFSAECAAARGKSSFGPLSALSMAAAS